MAAGAFTTLNIALEKMAEGAFDFENAQFRLILTMKDQPLNAAFAGTSGQALYEDLTDEVVGTGYTTGGKDMAGVSVSRSGAIVTVMADPVTWTAADITAKYGVVCLADSTGDPTDIIGFFDTETSNADGRASGGGDFIVNFSSGLFSLSRA